MRSSTAIFALGTFAAGTDAFVIAAFLPDMAAELGESEAATGQAVTVFSIAYAVLCPVLATATARLPRRLLLTSGLAVLAAGNLLAAAAPDLAFLLAARVLAAAGAAAYTPASFAVAAGLVPAERRGRAMAVVIGGLTAATAVGVPLGALIGRWAGWRTSLVLVAVLCAVAWAGVRLVMPVLPGAPPVPLRRRLAPLRRRAALEVLALTVLGMGGGYTVYAYAATVLPPEGAPVGVMLFLYGAGAVVGNLLSGAGSDRFGARTVLACGYAAQAASLALLGVLAALGASGPLALAAAGVLVTVWGGATWTQTPAQNSRLIERFGQADAPLTVSLNSAAIYAGIALGTGLGGAVLAVRPGAAVFAVAALAEACAVALLLATSRARPRAYAP
ncbi:MFS transporter [Spirillospora sp. NPDC050679]